MKRIAGALVLAMGLTLPMGIAFAQDHPEHHERQDRPHHEWNDSENGAWHQYLKEHHKRDREWNRASKREQRNYWKWRDQHQDVH
ncbi:MAG TPA: hypothetical protein VFA04_05765 [Bryobacteraceae bacterium]|nr:hypothetical protein [Bryobacteraceae bacterium]